MILVEGQEGQGSQFRMIIQPNQGFVKPVQTEDESEAQRLERYEKHTVWNQIQDLATFEDEDKLNEDISPNATKWNVDSECFYNWTTHTEGRSMFKSAEYQDFFTRYFEQNCQDE